METLSTVVFLRQLNSYTISEPVTSRRAKRVSGYKKNLKGLSL